MPKTPHSELDYIQDVIDLQKIDQSPYKHRRHFNEDKLRELAASIQREVCPKIQDSHLFIDRGLFMMDRQGKEWCSDYGTP